MEVIRLNNIKKSYINTENPLLKFATTMKLCNKPKQRHIALDGVSLSINKGETVGIIGRNGSGKSTLLKILAGITTPDSGKFEIAGKVSALLELGVGFNPEYSGVENIYLNGTINGLAKNDIKKDVSQILDFAEIDKEYANRPIKTYSTGMVVRLAFAAMVQNAGDIILADEALAVGDIGFQAKCYKKFEEIKSQNKTILFVSHDVDAIRRFCTKAVWLENGRVEEYGDVNYVTSRYMQSCVSDETTQPHDFGTSVINRYGSAVGCIKSVEFSKQNYMPGEIIKSHIKVEYPKGAGAKYCGVTLSVKDRYGLDLCVFRTSSPLSEGINNIELSFENILNNGEYFVAVGVENRKTMPISYYEYAECVAKFRSIKSDTDILQQFGLVILPHEIKIDQE